MILFVHNVLAELHHITTAPSGSPLSVSVLILSSSSVHISWARPLKHLQNGRIQYYTLSIGSGDHNIRKEVNSSYTTFENLHPHYTYVVSVAAVTVGTGPFSNATSFTMPQDGKLS